MEPRYSITLIRSLLLVAVFVMPPVPTGRKAQASNADEPISIGSVTVNPQANNRRAVLFKGKASDIRVISGADPFGLPTCGQAFTLEDTTGSIEVWYMIKCNQEANAVVVVENDQLLVAATIDAPPATDLKTSKNPDTGFRAMATKLIRAKP